MRLSSSKWVTRLLYYYIIISLYVYLCFPYFYYTLKRGISKVFYRFYTISLKIKRFRLKILLFSRWRSSTSNIFDAVLRYLHWWVYWASTFVCVITRITQIVFSSYKLNHCCPLLVLDTTYTIYGIILFSFPYHHA